VSKGFGLGAWISAKLYSKGATTASAEGVDFRELEALYPVFAMMQQLGMLLLVHLEPVAAHDGSEIDPWHREREGIGYLVALAEAFPKLKIVFEHISSRYGIEAVRELQRRGFPVEATIAPHYLVWTRAELVRGGMNPVAFSIPVLKEEEDRQALVDFMLEGGGFLGTDSAPHTVRAKSQPCGCPGGVFNDPVAVSVYFDIFKTEGERRGIKNWFDRFVAFACTKGPTFYGLPVMPGRTLIKEEPWNVPERYSEGDDAIIPMLAGEMVTYRVITE
jgi:dihydroorotase